MGNRKNNHLLLKLGILTAGTLACIHGVNQIIFYLAGKDDKPKKKDFVHHWTYGDIHYKVEGSGTPLLLIHDFAVGESSKEWNKIKDSYIQNDHKVYTVDLLGCGSSSRPAIEYTNYLYVQLLINFIHEVIKDTCDVITNGISSSFVLMADKMDSSLFHKIIFVNPISISASKQTPDILDHIKKHILELPVIGTFIYNLAFSHSECELTAKHSLVNSSLINTLAKRLYKNAHKPDSNARFLYASLISHYITIDIEQALKSCNKQFYLILGSDDANTAQTIDEFMSVRPGVSITTVNNTKKYPHMERPTRFVKITEQILKNE